MLLCRLLSALAGRSRASAADPTRDNRTGGFDTTPCISGNTLQCSGRYAVPRAFLPWESAQISDTAAQGDFLGTTSLMEQRDDSIVPPLTCGVCVGGGADATPALRASQDSPVHKRRMERPRLCWCRLGSCDGYNLKIAFRGVSYPPADAQTVHGMTFETFQRLCVTYLGFTSSSSDKEFLWLKYNATVVQKKNWKLSIFHFPSDKVRLMNGFSKIVNNGVVGHPTVSTELVRLRTEAVMSGGKTVQEAIGIDLHRRAYVARDLLASAVHAVQSIVAGDDKKRKQDRTTPSKMVMPKTTADAHAEVSEARRRANTADAVVDVLHDELEDTWHGMDYVSQDAEELSHLKERVQSVLEEQNLLLRAVRAIIIIIIIIKSIISIYHQSEQGRTSASLDGS